MPEAIVETVHRPARSRREALLAWMWLAWLALFVTLSYKLKVVGEIGVRPLYLAGVTFGVVLLAGLAIRLQRIRWRSAVEALMAVTLVLMLGYVFVQSLAYPSSFNDVVYAVSTVFLVYAISLMAAAVRGWHATLRDVYAALLLFSVANVVLVALSIVAPESVEGILVHPLLSGFGVRVSGMPGDPTHLGSLLSVTLLLMFVLRQETRSAWRPVWVVLLFAGTLATGSRNALLSLLAGCAVTTLAHRRGAIAMVWFGVASAALAGLAAVVIATTPAASNYVSEVFRVDDPNAYSRFQIWSDMAELASRLGPHEWLVGGGFLFIQDIYGSPYNAFLRVFFNHGLLIALVFVAVVLLLAASAAVDGAVLRRQAVLGLLAYWLTFSMFLDTFLAEFFHFAEFSFWLAAALVTSRSVQTHAGPAAPKRQ